MVILGEPNYLTDVGEAKGICKKGKKISLLSPKNIAYGRTLKGDKSSIGKLLSTHYGSLWKEKPQLSLYKRFFESTSSEELTQRDENTPDERDFDKCNNHEYIEMEI